MYVRCAMFQYSSTEQTTCWRSLPLVHGCVCRKTSWVRFCPILPCLFALHPHKSIGIKCWDPIAHEGTRRLRLFGAAARLPIRLITKWQNHHGLNEKQHSFNEWQAIGLRARDEHSRRITRNGSQSIFGGIMLFTASALDYALSYHFAVCYSSCEPSLCHSIPSSVMVNIFSIAISLPTSNINGQKSHIQARTHPTKPQTFSIKPGKIVNVFLADRDNFKKRSLEG